MSPSRSADAVSPDSPSSTSPTSPSSVPTSALFLPPSPSSSTPPSPSPSSPPPAEPDAAPSWSPDSEASATADLPDESSGTPSTDGPKSLVSKAGLRAVMVRAVDIVTGTVSTIAADATEREYGLWRADDDDQEGIAAPASRLVYRRLPDEAKNSDVLDLFSLALAVGGYLAKNLRLRAQLRAARAQADLAGEPAPDPATVDTSWPAP